MFLQGQFPQNVENEVINDDRIYIFWVNRPFKKCCSLSKTV